MGPLSAGLPWLRWSQGPKQQNFPLLALSFNHRRAAFYNCHAKDPHHKMVEQTLRQGLRRCRCLHKSTPSWVIEWLVGEHNRHHRGSGETALALIDEALRIEAQWRKLCTKEGTTTRHPQYQKMYDDFVRKESVTFKESVTMFSEAKSLGHCLESNDIYTEFQAGISGLQIHVVFGVVFCVPWA